MMTARGVFALQKKYIFAKMCKISNENMLFSRQIIDEQRLTARLSKKLVVLHNNSQKKFIFANRVRKNFFVFCGL
jgi:hypothetical protein